MNEHNKPQRNRPPQHQHRSPYQDEVAAEAPKQWRWSEWMLAKLRVDGGKVLNQKTEEEILEWHQHNTTIH